MMGSFTRLPPSLAAVVASFVLVRCQYPPPPVYESILKSPLDPTITVAYRQPDNGTCTTAFSTQRQYSGYIGIPPYTLTPIQQNYSINTFFWFIEARQLPEAAPLTIWLNGGPGSSSMVGLFNEVGPCEVVQTSDGTYGTQYRLWGWDRSSNILFIDQPNQVGFSFDLATNASVDLLGDKVFEPPLPPNPGLPPYMYLNGTFGTASSNSSTSYATTANTTDIAAQATWHFLQTWLAAFPQYNPATRPNVTTNYWGSTVPTDVNLFTESYGGKYGPVFARYFEKQNQLKRNGSLPGNSTLEIRLGTVGIMSGLIDALVQFATYPFFAYNNTYGIKAISQTDELNAINDYQGAHMCVDQIRACRTAMLSTDPDGYGDIEATNELCEGAQWTCNNITHTYDVAGYDPYDIRHKLPSPGPPAAYQEYLNTASVLAAIGAQINYTENSRYVQAGFISTGDMIRGGQIEDLAYLLSQGIRVALIHGDADFICNWYGGEQVSLAIAAQLASYSGSTTALPADAPSLVVGPSSHATAFPAAGYAEIVVNNTYVGGAVRQYGNISFSRIYDAGHLIPYFQPETAFTVFTRIIEGSDIATGNNIDISTFGTTGPANSKHTNSAPPAPSATCWVRSWNMSCTPDDTKAMLAGKGMVANGIFYQDVKSISLPTTTVTVGVPGHPISISSGEAGQPIVSDGSTTRLTGVYTATGTPNPKRSGAAPGLLEPFQVRTMTAALIGLVFGIMIML